MSCTVALAEGLFEPSRIAVSRRSVFKPQLPAPNLFDLPPEIFRRWKRENPTRPEEDAERWDGLS
jgi:hypothetical protein